MTAQQAEFVAFTAEVAATTASVAHSIKQLESFLSKTNAEATVAGTLIAELQNNYVAITVNAAPCSAAIQSGVAASEQNAEVAIAEVRALFDATNTEVQELRRRATEVEQGNKGDRKTKWEMSRPKDLEPSAFGSKEERWPKFREELMDFAEAVHPGLKSQLEYTLRQKEEITSFVMKGNPLGSAEDDWELRHEVYKELKRKTEPNSDARKIVECVEQSNGFEV